MTEVRPIHPDTSRPTHAESPFTRKLKRIREDVKLAQEFTNSIEVAARLELILVELDLLIKGE